MSTKDYQFKTNMKCDGCIATVKPYLDAAEGVCEWSVNLNNPNKVLNVNTDNLSEQEIIEIVKKAGYTAELLA